MSVCRAVKYLHTSFTIHSKKLSPVMPEADFESFRRLVLQDLQLQAQLRDESDQQEFIALAVRLGAERGCHFTAEEVTGALLAARRAWIERWFIR